MVTGTIMKYSKMKEMMECLFYLIMQRHLETIRSMIYQFWLPFDNAVCEYLLSTPRSNPPNFTITKIGLTLSCKLAY